MTGPKIYYNEYDPYAAQWLRNLMALGVIAHGVVDERSIEDVTPAELLGYTQCHFFAGIGVWNYALRRIGWDDTRPIWTGSCPCQPFSAAGEGKGFADERHLWPAFHHLIKHAKPAGVPVIGEQVAGSDGLEWFDLVCADMENEDHACWAIDLCAAGVGSANIRQRLYWLATDRIGVVDAQGVWQRGYTGKSRDTAAAVQGEARADHGPVAGGAGGIIGLGNAIQSGSQGHSGDEPDAPGRQQGQAGPVATAGADGGMGDPERIVSGRRPGKTRRTKTQGGGEQKPGDHGFVDAGQGAGGMAHADGGIAGPEREQRSGEHGFQPFDRGIFERLCGRPIEYGKSRGGARPGALNGFWADADWLGCRDGKWRPVEPGTFPLVDGSAFDLGPGCAIEQENNPYAGKSRIEIIKGYGNALNAETATVFCTAVREMHDALEAA